jgi:hypothetical protein
MTTTLNQGGEGGGRPPPQPAAAAAPDFNDDVLRGALEIAAFLYKGDPMKNRRKVFHLVETSRIPFFREGSKVCARKSTLLNWIAEQEARGKRNADPKEE